MITNRKLTALALALGFFAAGLTPSNAGYDENRTGEITHIFTYPAGQIYIRLSNQPSSHPECNPAYFAIDSTAPGKDAMYARALAAFTAGQPVNIGYDSQGNCASGQIRIHRVG